MKNIKFRAWIKTGIETYDYVNPMTIQQMIHSKKSTFSLKQLNDLVDFEQFTGMRDVNGKDIYEGDIIEFFGANKKLKSKKNLELLFIKPIDMVLALIQLFKIRNVVMVE